MTGLATKQFTPQTPHGEEGQQAFRCSQEVQVIQGLMAQTAPKTVDEPESFDHAFYQSLLALAEGRPFVSQDFPTLNHTGQ